MEYQIGDITAKANDPLGAAFVAHMQVSHMQSLMKEPYVIGLQKEVEQLRQAQKDALFIIAAFCKQMGGEIRINACHALTLKNLNLVVENWGDFGTHDLVFKLKGE